MVMMMMRIYMYMCVHLYIHTMYIVCIYIYIDGKRLRLVLRWPKVRQHLGAPKAKGTACIVSFADFGVARV